VFPQTIVQTSCLEAWSNRHLAAPWAASHRESWCTRCPQSHRQLRVRQSVRRTAAGDGTVGELHRRSRTRRTPRAETARRQKGTSTVHPRRVANIVMNDTEGILCMQPLGRRLVPRRCQWRAAHDGPPILKTRRTDEGARVERPGRRAVQAPASRRTSGGVDLTDQLKLLTGERASIWLNFGG
jgi:hypothetical protein